MTYMFAMGPALYDADRNGRPLSLVACLIAVYGVGQARIYRTDGTLVVDRAGSSVEIVHAPTGRRISR
jgi:hypothetical protein